MSAPLKKKSERRVFGVGRKAPSTKVYAFENKVMLWKCPYYVLWTSILRRCYSEIFLLKNPTYRGCIVDETWHTFENFKSWVKENPNKTGFLDKTLELDKDLLGDGKTYGPDKCVFVPAWLNCLLNDRQGDAHLPLGVYFNKETGKYKSQISNRGKREFLGYFEDACEAHRAWQKRKVEILMLARKEYLLSTHQDERVGSVLKTICKNILQDMASGNLTHRTLRK